MPEQDVGELSLVSCCMTEISSTDERVCLYELCKASNTVWK